VTQEGFVSSELMSRDDLAEFYGVPRRTVERWDAEGKGPPRYRVGRHTRYRRAEVERWLESHRVDREPAQAGA
jgi:excisionase family DNA binding protein